jgi:hypothetical protein
MLIVIACFVSSFVGAFLGWKFTAKHERLRGYAEAVDDQFKRLREIPKLTAVRRSRSNLRALEGGKK